MQVMELIRKLQDNGANRISGALAQTPWAVRRQRRRTFRRLWWVAGIAVGIALVAVLVWAALGRCAEEVAAEEEEEMGLS
jgi:hypothetical protein